MTRPARARPATTTTATDGSHALAGPEFAAGDRDAFARWYDRHAAAICAQAQWAAPLGDHETAAAWALAAWRDLIDRRHRPLPDDVPMAAWLMARVHHHAALQAPVSDQDTDGTGQAGLAEHPSLVSIPDSRPASDALPWHLWPVPLAAHRDANDALTADERHAQPLTQGAADALWTAAGRRLRQGLLRLPQSVRGVFLMHHGAGWSVSIIARAQSTAPDTVERRLHAAVSALRDHLGAYDAPPITTG